MKYFFAIIFLYSTIFAKAQNDFLSIKKIDSIVKSIDTVKTYESIADAIIQRVKREKIIGGYTDTYSYIEDSSKKILLKAEERKTLHYADYSTYYFYHDSLIYVTLERHNRNHDKTVAGGKYYFQNDALIYKEEKGTPIKKPKEFLQQARFFIKDLNSQ